MNIERGKFRHEYNGVIYTSVKSLAKVLDFKLSTFQKWIQKSDSVEQAIESCNNSKKKGLTYKGVLYPTLKHLAKAYNIKFDTLKLRLYVKKMSLDEAITKPVKVIRKVEDIEFQGNVYRGIENIAKAYSMSSTCLNDRLSKGMSLEEALLTPVLNTGKRKPIQYNGKPYNSISDLARDNNLSPSLVTYRINKGVDTHKILSPVGSIYSGKSQEIEYKGVKYDSHKDLAEAYNIDYYILISRLNRGWLLETAMTKPVYSICIVYKDKEYTNYQSLADEYNMPVDILRYRLKAGWDTEKAITTPINHKMKKRK